MPGNSTTMRLQHPAAYVLALLNPLAKLVKRLYKALSQDPSTTGITYMKIYEDALAYFSALCLESIQWSKQVLCVIAFPCANSSIFDNLSL